MRTKLASAILVSGLVFFGTACGGGESPDTSPDGPGDPEGQGDEFDYSDHFEQAPASISDNGALGDYDCDGQTVTIEADDVVIFLHGTCENVVINGESNSVSIDVATEVTVNGDYANISVTADVATITINGNYSEVRYEGSPDITVTGENSNAIPH